MPLTARALSFSMSRGAACLASYDVPWASRQKIPPMTVGGTKGLR